MKIKITTKAAESVEAILNQENPMTAKAVLETLPMSEKANTWGDEVTIEVA